MTRAELRILEDVARGEIGPGLQARAQAVVARVAAAHRRRLAKSRTRRRADDQRAALRRATHLALITRVRTRAGDWCELGGHPHLATELSPHHLLSGSGRRQQEETEENVTMACSRCHDAFHQNPSAFREVVLAWCRRWGYPIPNRKELRNG